MGIGPGSRSCYTNTEAIAPNPNPDNWEILRRADFPNGYALKIQYAGCTNFEGIKILVYEGKYRPMLRRDPHFSEDKAQSPIARFRPDDYGWWRAVTLAKSL